MKTTHHQDGRIEVEGTPEELAELARSMLRPAPAFFGFNYAPPFVSPQPFTVQQFGSCTRCGGVYGHHTAACQQQGYNGPR